MERLEPVTKKPDKPKPVCTSLYLKQELLDELSAEAKRIGVSRNKTIESILKMYFTMET
jgi:metal-responsive CopG/Arc/MetJ family transcriptional regulator